MNKRHSLHIEKYERLEAVTPTRSLQHLACLIVRQFAQPTSTPGFRRFFCLILKPQLNVKCLQSLFLQRSLRCNADHPIRGFHQVVALAAAALPPQRIYRLQIGIQLLRFLQKTSPAGLTFSRFHSALERMTLSASKESFQIVQRRVRFFSGRIRIHEEKGAWSIQLLVQLRKSGPGDVSINSSPPPP